ncbi:MAG: hypothetical protein J5858_02355 [Lentisphaeria bacterium]|nr:hypothetical protein [Lentisphaeria bacterium]
MSGDKNKDQLTFDFSDFFSDGRPSGEDKPGLKIRDDMTPGLFDPEVSEEEEMRDFFHKIHSEESAEVDSNSPETEPDFPFDSSAAPSIGSIPEKTEEAPAGKNAELTRKQLQRAALAFLASLNPSGLGTDVIARGSRFKASAAAFRIDSGKVAWTAVAEVRTSDKVNLETAGNAEQFKMLKLARMEREMLEQEIRRTEPELRDGAMLFPEFEQWNYEKAENSAYQECLRKIRHLEHSVFRGSRLERFQTARSASELYLVVPDKAVDPELLADGWGLVYIKSDLSFELVKPPVRYEIPEENRIRLALNIASSNAAEVLFCNGIRINSDGLVHCGPLPRRRWRKS